MHCLICEWFPLFMDMTEWLTEWFSNNPVFLVSIIFSCFYVSITCTTTWTQQCSTSLHLFCCSLWNRQLKWKVAPTNDWLTDNFFCSKTSKFALLPTVDKLRMQVKFSVLVASGTNLWAVQRALKANSWNDPMWEHHYFGVLKNRSKNIAMNKE